MEVQVQAFVLFFSQTLLVTCMIQQQMDKVEDMARTPFILNTGELYRDMLTVETSKLAAQFAKQYQPQVKDMAQTNKARSMIETLMNPPPNFANNRFVQKGNKKEDNEIFDFTDSRFVNPPAPNRQNFPLVEEEAPLAGISVVTPAPTTPHPTFSRFTYPASPQTAPSYVSTPEPIHFNTPSPSYILNPSPSYISTPSPSYLSNPSLSYLSSPSPTYASNPTQSYISTPSPQYQYIPLQSQYLKPEPELKTNLKPFIHLGSSLKNYHYSPTSLLSRQYSPTPSPPPAHLYSASPPPSYHYSPTPTPSPFPSYHYSPTPTPSHPPSYHYSPTPTPSPPPSYHYSPSASPLPANQYSPTLSPSILNPSRYGRYNNLVSGAYSPKAQTSYNSIDTSTTLPTKPCTKPPPSYQHFSIGNPLPDPDSSYNSFVDYNFRAVSQELQEQETHLDYQDYQQQADHSAAAYKTDYQVFVDLGKK